MTGGADSSPADRVWVMKTRQRQVLAALLVFLLCFSGTYLFAASDGSQPDPGPETPPPTSDPPNVTVTPPENTTPTEPPTPNTTTTPPPTEPPIDASLRITGEETLTVHSATGDVETLRGRLNGTVSWNPESADSVVLVVQTWVPNQGWNQTRRVQVDKQPPVSIGEILDSPLRYADAGRTDAFENPSDGTTQSQPGMVAVTAVFFDDGNEQDRVTREWEYTVSVTNYDSGDDPSGDDEVELDLDIGGSNESENGSEDDSGNGGLLNGSQATPGAQYASSADIANTGSETGSVFLNVSYTSFENGIANEAEGRVDSTGGDPGPGRGELHQEFELRVAIVDDNGSLTYVLGNESTYRGLTNVTGEPVPLTDIPPGGTADLHVEYRVDPAAGNEIQSDTLTLDFEFLLEQT